MTNSKIYAHCIVATSTMAREAPQEDASLETNTEKRTSVSMEKIANDRDQAHRTLNELLKLGPQEYMVIKKDKLNELLEDYMHGGSKKTATLPSDLWERVDERRALAGDNNFKGNIVLATTVEILDSNIPGYNKGDTWTTDDSSVPPQ